MTRTLNRPNISLATASAPHLATTPVHGGQLQAVAQCFGIPAEQLTDFSASINPDGPPATVLSTLQQALHDPATLMVYPDLEQTALKQAISRHARIEAECISVANGFAPLLRAALHANKIRHCLLPVPAFGEYRRSLEQAGILVTPYLLEPRDFLYQTPAMLQALLALSDDSAVSNFPAVLPDAILIANPQNPSGALTSATDLLALVQAVAAHGITVFLDEAFIDYVHEQSLVQQAAAQPNLVVFRSVTKFYAIPGLRVAYAVSHVEQTSAIAQALPPWPVSTLDSLAAAAALNDAEYAEQSRQNNLVRRASLQRQLEHLGLVVYPSSANFLLLRLPPYADAQALRERLIREKHVVVRACDSFEGLSPNHLRVAVRSEEANTRLIHAFGKILRS